MGSGGWTKLGRAADLAQLWGTLPDWLRGWLLWLGVSLVGGAIWSRFSAWPFELLVVFAGLLVACVTGAAAAITYIFRRPSRATETYEGWKAVGHDDFIQRLRAEAAENRRLLGVLSRQVGPDQAQWVDQPAEVEARVEALLLLNEAAVIMLQNRDVNNQHDLEKWKSDFSWWQARVVQALEKAKAPAADISDFQTLRLHRVFGLPGWNPEHAKLRDILAEKCERIAAIAHRMDRR